MVDTVLSAVQKLLEWVLVLLPTSPFVSFIDAFEKLPYLSWLNWLVPIGSFIAIGEAWLISIGIFYLYSVILRWVKAIE